MSNILTSKAAKEILAIPSINVCGPWSQEITQLDTNLNHLPDLQDPHPLLPRPRPHRQLGLGGPGSDADS